jgi:hypothetical protein
MRRIFRLFSPAAPAAAARPSWTLSAEQYRHVMALLAKIGLDIVAEARGPVPLMTFGRRVLDRLDPPGTGPGAGRFGSIPPIPLNHFADALKTVIRDMDDERLRVMSPTDFPGVGYVFDAADENTRPVRSSR